MTRVPSIEDCLREADSLGVGVRAYLREAREYLGALDVGGASGREVNAANTGVVDRLVLGLFARARDELPPQLGSQIDGLCVVAMGGYARGEMSIHSDVDLLFLYEPPLAEGVATLTERIKMWLWDAGLKVGCATRTQDETLTLAGRDATVHTSLLDARYLVGNEMLFRKFRDAVRQGFLEDAEAFVSDLVTARTARHAKYGESLYLLQPNVKEGVGALRDHHSALWAARALLPSLTGLQDLERCGLLTAAELAEYQAALDFLWRVRNGLHRISGRANDQMSFELQEQLAEAFGYGSPKGSAVELPVERFMRDYYRHARAVQSCSDLVLEQCQERARSEPVPEGREVEEGFRIRGEVLQIPDAAHLRARPVRLLLAFEVAQRHDVGLSRMARRLIRGELGLIDDAFRGDPEASACFLRILGAPLRVTRSLLAMNEVGLLGAYLPEWEHIVCRWQHVIYHTYTVDVHSIFLVEELRRLWRGKYRQALPQLTDLVEAETDLPVLYLGCLLHDIGKGLGGDHSNRGAELAARCVQRLGLSAERAARVVFLVRFHLLMSHLAQRRDLTDPKLIVEFVRTVGDRRNLRNLHLLTFADIRASSRSAWSDWKGQLIRELFEQAAEHLETGEADPERADAQIEARVQARRETARAELAALGVGATKIDAYFAAMPRRYFVAHTPRQIARHALVVLGLGPEQTVSTAVRAMRGDFSEFIVCTLDVHGLYSKVAGVLTAKRVNILDSHVYTLRTGLALEIYRVTTPVGGAAELRETWRGVDSMLHAVLTGVVRVEDLVRRQRRPVGRARPPAPKPPVVSISNEESDFYTIVDVSANDRLGLLYDLTRTIAQHDLEIYLSKAATVLDQVVDAFYVKDREGKKLTVPEKIRSLQDDLLKVVREGEAAETHA